MDHIAIAAPSLRFRPFVRARAPRASGLERRRPPPRPARTVCMRASSRARGLSRILLNRRREIIGDRARARRTNPAPWSYRSNQDPDHLSLHVRCTEVYTCTTAVVGYSRISLQSGPDSRTVHRGCAGHRAAPRGTRTICGRTGSHVPWVLSETTYAAKIEQCKCDKCTLSATTSTRTDHSGLKRQNDEHHQPGSPRSSSRLACRIKNSETRHWTAAAIQSTLTPGTRPAACSAFSP